MKGKALNILLVSPLGYAINKDSRYTGIERLAFEYSRELVKDHKVTVMGHAKSIFPEGVSHLFVQLETNEDTNMVGELRMYQSYQYLLRQFDVIHDFSHQHLVARFNPNFPILNIFWHAPALAKYPKAPYNIIALSRWAAREFRRVYGQSARYQQSILINTEEYQWSNRHRGDRFLTLGRMGKDKGNLNAIHICLEAKVPLDVAGGSCGETDYENEIRRLCDGKQIRFLGEVTEEDKRRLMQDCRALLYVTDHPEVTSHKIQEALLMGSPVVVPNLGALPEIVTQGVDGFLCRTKEDYLKAIKDIPTLDGQKTKEQLRQRYSVENVVRDYLPLYQSVAEGLRW